MSIVSETATLAYGYTMDEIDGIARLATRLHPSRAIDADEALALAWHAVVEALYTADTEPSRRDLVEAGSRALTAEVKLVLSFKGINTGRTRDKHDFAPHFQKYWRSLEGHDDFTDRIVERLALPAVLAVLTPKEYEAISTLAAFDGDSAAAARSLGMRRDAFAENAKRARRRIRALWFEGETPRAMVSRDPAKCRNGHSRAEHGYRDTLDRWVCRLCRKSINRRADRRHKARKKTEALNVAGVDG